MASSCLQFLSSQSPEDALVHRLLLPLLVFHVGFVFAFASLLPGFLHARSVVLPLVGVALFGISWLSFPRAAYARSVLFVIGTFPLSDRY